MGDTRQRSTLLSIHWKMQPLHCRKNKYFVQKAETQQARWAVRKAFLYGELFTGHRDRGAPKIATKTTSRTLSVPGTLITASGQTSLLTSTPGGADSTKLAPHWSPPVVRPRYWPRRLEELTPQSWLHIDHRQWSDLATDLHAWRIWLHKAGSTLITSSGQTSLLTSTPGGADSTKLAPHWSPPVVRPRYWPPSLEELTPQSWLHIDHRQWSDLATDLHTWRSWLHKAGSTLITASGQTSLLTSTPGGADSTKLAPHWSPPVVRPRYWPRRLEELTPQSWLHIDHRQWSDLATDLQAWRSWLHKAGSTLITASGQTSLLTSTPGGADSTKLAPHSKPLD